MYRGAGGTGHGAQGGSVEGAQGTHCGQLNECRLSGGVEVSRGAGRGLASPGAGVPVVRGGLRRAGGPDAPLARGPRLAPRNAAADHCAATAACARDQHHVALEEDGGGSAASAADDLYAEVAEGRSVRRAQGCA